LLLAHTATHPQIHTRLHTSSMSSVDFFLDIFPDLTAFAARFAPGLWAAMFPASTAQLCPTPTFQVLPGAALAWPGLECACLLGILLVVCCLVILCVCVCCCVRIYSVWRVQLSHIDGGVTPARNTRSYSGLLIGAIGTFRHLALSPKGPGRWSWGLSFLFFGLMNPTGRYICFLVLPWPFFLVRCPATVLKLHCVLSR
jgi:hypothetical protein